MALINSGWHGWLQRHADVLTHALQTIAYPHSEIHEGRHFFLTDVATVAATGTRQFLLTTPNTTRLIHCIFKLSSTLDTTVELFEASDRTGTNLLAPINNYRDSPNSATATVHEGTSGGTTDGTLIYNEAGGLSAGGQRVFGAEIRQEFEIILKANTKYLLKITSGTNANVISSRISWYEHINR